MNRKACSIGGSLLLAAGLAVSGCGSSGSTSAASSCPTKTGKAVTASSPVAATGKPAAGWTLPGADLANTRDVASAITSTNVSKLGVAWTVPLHTSLSHTDGAYATTPVIVNGVVYVQDLQSNVMAISLATGKVLWTHTYNSPNGGPDGVNVVGGVVYGATNHAAFALDAATGTQVWSRTVIGSDHEGIDMTPGYNHGTVYVSTVPVNPTVGEYLGGGKATLWALNAATGAPEWSWDEVQDLWGARRSTPAAASGTRHRSTPRATCTSAWPTRPRSSALRASRWGAAGRVLTCTPTRWSSSARTASSCGITS
jgi:outer membrane protein assembly factor BamB